MFSKIIRSIDNPRYMMHDYITIFLPSLDIKEPDINMTIYLSGNTVVHNINSSIVVIMNWIRRVMGNPSYQIMDIKNLAVLASGSHGWR